MTSGSIFSFHLIKWIFLVQCIFIALHVFISLVIYPISFRYLKRKSYRFSLLKEELIACIEKGMKWSDLPSYLCKITTFVPLITEVDKKVKNWDELKKSVFENILFPKARKDTYSRSWIKRVQATSCFLSYPDIQNEPYIIHLLSDSIPIVQYSAAYSATKLGTKRCVNAVIDVMNLSDRFLRHPYIQAFLKGNPKGYKYLEERLEISKNPHTRRDCLEVLAHHMNSHIFELIKKDLCAQDKNLRLGAIRSLGRYPSLESNSLLMDLLEDQMWEVRAVAARSLGYLKVKEALDKLSFLLKDKVWWVRMNAALALKRLGDEGKKQLEKQDPKENRYAYEIAQYVLPIDQYE